MHWRERLWSCVVGYFVRDIRSGLMAMELYVLSDQRLSSIAEWQQAIDAEGFALQLSRETPLDAVDGFLPAQLNREPTGFECNH
jgi:hypothetical protein